MKKTTKELIELMKQSRDYDAYLSENGGELSQEHMKIDRALNILVQEKGAKKSAVIAKSGLENHYAYQIFSGTKKPTRDKVIMLCFGLELTAEETQQLLKVTGYPQLYGKEARDNAIIYGITKRLSIIDMNNMLYDLGHELLT